MVGGVQRLRALHLDLWPDGLKGIIALEASRTLQLGEVQEVLRIIEDNNLLTQMFCPSHFGGKPG